MQLREVEFVVSAENVRPLFHRTNKSAVTIGRDESCDISLNSSAVSRVHAQLTRKDQEWYVTDLSSTNGTYINENRISPNQPRRWSDTDVLLIGPYSVRIILPAYHSIEPTMILDPHTQSPVQTPTMTILPTSEMMQELKEMSGKLPHKPFVIPPTELSAEANPSPIDTWLEPGTAEAVPGHELLIRVGVRNHSDYVRRFVLSVEGLPDDWYNFSRQVLTVAPNAKSTSRLVINIPPAQTPTEVDYVVLIQDEDDKEVSYTIAAELLIVGKSSVAMQLKPSENPREVLLQLANTGNVVESFTIEPQYPEDLFAVDGEYWGVDLPPGQTVEMSYRIDVGRRPLWGRPHQETVDFLAKSSNGTQRILTHTLEVRPHIRAWVLLTVLLFFLLGVTAALLYYYFYL